MTREERRRYAPYLTLALIVLMLSHTHVRLLGPLSLLQVAIGVLYGALVFPRHLKQLALSAAVLLTLSTLQFWLFNARLPSSEFPERVFTYPVLFFFLIVFCTTVADLYNQRWLSPAWIGRGALVFLLISAAQAGVSLQLERIGLISFFYDNPNEIAVACTAALFYLAVARAPPLQVYMAGACTIFVTFVGGARFSIVYALLILLIYSFAAFPRQGTWAWPIRIGGYAAAGLAVVVVAATFATNTIFHIGGLDELGIVPEALWQGWHAQTPATTSLGFRINNILASVGTLIQTGGFGIGIGRSAGLTEAISGLGGSIHVPPVEILVELGAYGCLTLAWINLRGSRMSGLPTIALWFLLGSAGLAVQSSAYLTSYLAWFFVVAVCAFRRDNDRTDIGGEDQVPGAIHMSLDGKR